MNERYSTILKIALAAALGLLAIVVPVFTFKLLLATVGIIIFAISLKKFKTLFITLTIILIVIPLVVIAGIKGLTNLNFSFLNNLYSQGFFKNLSRFENYDYDYNPDLKNSTKYNEILEPEIFIDDASDLAISSVGVIIEADPRSDKILIPDDLEYYYDNNNVLHINMPKSWKDKTARIVLGTKNFHTSIKITAVAVEIPDGLQADTLQIEGEAIKIDGYINAENIILQGVACSITGDIKSKTIILSGMVAVSIKNKMEVEYLTINNSQAANIKTSLRGTSKIILNSTSMNAKITYTDTWEGKRFINADSLAGNIKLYIPRNNNGNLDINTSGIINVSKSYY
ncbi:MAG: hypothetical protein PWQ27_986 [Kosmotoga sp.]|nr:hypothetical protein [Kosmotoga sp.]